jgi:hypothetical protein
MPPYKHPQHHSSLLLSETSLAYLEETGKIPHVSGRFPDCESFPRQVEHLPAATVILGSAILIVVKHVKTPTVPLFEPIRYKYFIYRGGETAF